MSESIQLSNPRLICRGCLEQDVPMKNMYEWKMVDDFYRITEVEIKRSDGMSLCICRKCEALLNACISFRIQCQRTELVLMDYRKNHVVHKTTKMQVDSNAVEENMQKVEKSTILIEFDATKLTYSFTPIDREKQNMPCPYHCDKAFGKISELRDHLKTHGLAIDNFSVHQKFQCPYKKCHFNVDSVRSKFFSTRKLLCQHLNKVHERTGFCDVCNVYVGKDMSKHMVVCRKDFVCKLCDSVYKTDDRLSVHMLRKHPEVYEQYKRDRRVERDRLKSDGNTANGDKAGNTEQGCKGKKRSEETHGSLAKKCKRNVKKYANINERNETAKKISEHSEDTTTKAFIESYSEYIFDSSRRQNENVKKDKMAAPVQSDSLYSDLAIDNTKQKQNNFADYLNDSPKCQSAEASTEIENYTYAFDSPKRSFATQTLSDQDRFACVKNDVNLSWQGKKATTETQTAFDDIFLKSDSNEDMFFPETAESMDFGLKKNNYTQSPDLSMKETQTCCCLSDPPKTTAFSRLFDSITSSPTMNFTSTETQTQEFSTCSNVKSDVLLSFSSAWTQTCADESDF